MRHRVAGRKLGRTAAHRQAMMRNMSASLIDKERITTTLAKAKELRKFAERLVTLAKRETLHSRRRVLRHIPDRKLVAKLFDTLSARYAQRPGGYTRIIKLGPRRGDCAEMCVIELVGAEAGRAAEAADTKDSAKKTPKRAKSASGGGEKKATKKKTAKKSAASHKEPKAKPKAPAKTRASKAAKKASKRATRSKG
jgi:large subunit ribosomal protein L17